MAELAGLSYSQPNDTELLSRALDAAEQELEGRRTAPSLYDIGSEEGHDWAKRALVSRVIELRQELKLSILLGSGELLANVRAHYACVTDLDAANELALAWLREDLLPQEGPRVSLFDFMLRKAAKLPGIRVIERPLLSRAAAGEGVLYVRPNTHVFEAEAERIWLHEVEGHLSMRQRARALGPPFLAGSKEAWMDEEGRAVWLEETHGYLKPQRRRELALAHVVGLRILSGRAPLEVFEELRGDGQEEPLLITAICRAARGGGLCRELGYLIGYVRILRAYAEEPLIVDFLGLGRLSVRVALELSQNTIEAESVSHSSRATARSALTSPTENR